MLKVGLLIDMRGVEERREGRYTVATLGQLQKSEKELKRKIRKEKKELRKGTVRKIKEQGGISCNLFWKEKKNGLLG